MTFVDECRLRVRQNYRGTLRIVDVVAAPIRLRIRVTYAVVGPSAVVHSVSVMPAGGRRQSFGGL